MWYQQNKIVAAAFNYKDLRSNEKSPEYPVLFMKSPTSIIYKGEYILVPKPLHGKVWGEVELALEIGDGVYNPTSWGDRRIQDIAGIRVANDVSAYNVNDMDVHLAFSKAVNNFCPISGLIEFHRWKDLNNLRLISRINGVVVQDSNTKHMFYKPKKLLDYISTYIYLIKGDLVLTGTPKHDKTILYDGDEIEVEIDGIGSVKNTVVYV